MMLHPWDTKGLIWFCVLFWTHPSNWRTLSDWRAALLRAGFKQNILLNSDAMSCLEQGTVTWLEHSQNPVLKIIWPFWCEAPTLGAEKACYSQQETVCGCSSAMSVKLPLPVKAGSSRSRFLTFSKAKLKVWLLRPQIEQKYRPYLG